MGRVGGIGLAFAVNIILARTLSQRDFGVFVLLSSIVTVGGVVARFGLDRAMLRFVSEGLAFEDRNAVQRTLLNGFFVATGSTAVTSLVLLVGLRTLGERLFKLPEIGGLAIYAAIGVVLVALVQLSAESIRGFHELRLASLFQVHTSGGPLVNLLFVSFFLAGAQMVEPSLQLVFAAFLLAPAILLPPALLLLIRTAKARLATAPKPYPACRPIRPGALIGAGMPIMLSQLGSYLLDHGGIYIAGASFTSDQLACYGAASRLAQVVALPLYLANLTVISTIPELFARRRTADLQRMLRGAATVASAVSLLVTLPIMLAPGSVLHLLYGEAYRGAAPVLAILCVGQLVQSWTGSCGMSLLLTGYHYVDLLVNAAMGIVLLVAGSVAAARFGPIALAVVCAAALSGCNLAKLLLTRGLIGVWTHAAFAPWIRARSTRP